MHILGICRRRLPKIKKLEAAINTIKVKINDPAKKSIRTPEIYTLQVMKEKINWSGPPGIACFGGAPHQSWSVEFYTAEGFEEIL